MTKTNEQRSSTAPKCETNQFGEKFGPAEPAYPKGFWGRYSRRFPISRDNPERYMARTAFILGIAHFVLCQQFIHFDVTSEQLYTLISILIIANPLLLATDLYFRAKAQEAEK